MNEEVFYYLDNWLKQQGYRMAEDSMDWIHRILWLIAVLLFAYLIAFICRKVVLPLIEKVVSKKLSSKI